MEDETKTRRPSLSQRVFALEQRLSDLHAELPVLIRTELARATDDNLRAFKEAVTALHDDISGKLGALATQQEALTSWRVATQAIVKDPVAEAGEIAAMRLWARERMARDAEERAEKVTQKIAEERRDRIADERNTRLVRIGRSLMPVLMALVILTISSTYGRLGLLSPALQIILPIVIVVIAFGIAVWLAWHEPADGAQTTALRAPPASQKDEAP